MAIAPPSAKKLDPDASSYFPISSVCGFDDFISNITKKLIKDSLTPVPYGPRSTRKEFQRDLQKVKRVVSAAVAGAGAGDWRWQEKKNPPKGEAGLSEKREKQSFGRRWKDNNGGYKEILPLCREDEATSVMIRNIPNKYTRELLVQTLDNHCKVENKKIKGEKSLVSSYDFVYLPIDFKRRVNAGFAFVNFSNAKAAMRFHEAFNGKHWDFFGSPKVAEITKARIQGKEALINNCRAMDFTYGSDKDMPVWFDPARDGSGQYCKMNKIGKYVHWDMEKSNKIVYKR